MKQVTKNVCLVYRFVRNCREWTTVGVIAKEVTLPLRTVRFIVKDMADQGVFDVRPVHGGFRYRLCREPTVSNKEVMNRIHEAEKIFTPEAA